MNELKPSGFGTAFAHQGSMASDAGVPAGSKKKWHRPGFLRIAIEETSFDPFPGFDGKEFKGFFKKKSP